MTEMTYSYSFAPWLLEEVVSWKEFIFFLLSILKLWSVPRNCSVQPALKNESLFQTKRSKTLSSFHTYFHQKINNFLTIQHNAHVNCTSHTATLPIKPPIEPAHCSCVIVYPHHQPSFLHYHGSSLHQHGAPHPIGTMRHFTHPSIQQHRPRCTARLQGASQGP